ncbi:hypothetical protein S40285_07557 [Stachybotrys chlorohalonatus IBT 40285]|uniref:Sec39 domain-containing protein n=1 Tax=Stachybotrys chlorohalonatus (strain IBT 40285) TaxID=1283841 RepID=A0A084QFP0_STAC4|nr:hypothetical protein S40285_07557 [Stachybotrys chlorohalonata IBT 40285]
MATTLIPAKVVLLAVHLAAHADLNCLATLTASHDTILHQELLLRILLTHLPETTRPSSYVGFLQQLRHNGLSPEADNEIDLSPVDSLTDEQATKGVAKLHLLRLSYPGASSDVQHDPITLFLLARAYRVDEEAGLMSQLPALLLPFLDHSPAIRNWMLGTLLPLLRRNFEYYPHHITPYTLSEFEKLPEGAAVEYLLSQTGTHDDQLDLVGRDFRGMLAPWLHGSARWAQKAEGDADAGSVATSTSTSCTGWEQALQWLLLQASQSWRVAVAVIEQWDGPHDVEPFVEAMPSHEQSRQRYLADSYVRAAVASAYLIPEATLPALEGAYRIVDRVMRILDQDTALSFQETISQLPDLTLPPDSANLGSRIASFMRNDLLEDANPLTAPNSAAVRLLTALTVSAFFSTRLGVPLTIRQAGELAFLRDEREQKSEVAKLIRIFSAHGANLDDTAWRNTRREVIWLHNWGAGDDNQNNGEVRGIFGAVSKHYIEIEFLKSILANSRYALAKSLYEDGPEELLPPATVQEVVYNAALNAFDNASNPNRNRGGLKKCDEIIKSLPKIMSGAPHMATRVESLLRATHALSDYRLVLKQGEPFNPVVLRVHSDPILIIQKVLEQNPKGYTRLQEFLETGINMVRAGLLTHSKPSSGPPAAADQNHGIAIVEKRIVAMCIESALREDDFETAYSYVVSRLDSTGIDKSDEWSWSAALKAGQYLRTEKSLQPTHLGTASGNLDIRHLEQRIECLATALRVAPPSQLQEILKTFRRCEEQLDSAIQEEAAKEAAWDIAGDVEVFPGAFNTPEPLKAYPPRNLTASAAARQGDEAPMSLFDLSRATARAAQRNLTALSSLQVMGQEKSPSQKIDVSAQNQDQQRVRKRDQFRDAATETLVSGVGWLIGANVNRGRADAD